MFAKINVDGIIMSELFFNIIIIMLNKIMLPLLIMIYQKYLNVKQRMDLWVFFFLFLKCLVQDWHAIFVKHPFTL